MPIQRSQSKKCPLPIVTPTNWLVISEMIIFRVYSSVMCYIPHGPTEKKSEEIENLIGNMEYEWKSLMAEGFVHNLYPLVVL